MYVKKIVFIVEYDFIMVIYFVDCVIVFDGQFGIDVYVNKFEFFFIGCNIFLKNLDVIFCCDFINYCFCINKVSFQFDQEQKFFGNYVSLVLIF